MNIEKQQAHDWLFGTFHGLWFDLFLISLFNKEKPKIINWWMMHNFYCAVKIKNRNI